MKIWFLLREGLAGFRRARLAVTLAIFSITLSLCLIGIFGLLAQNVAIQFQELYQKTYVEVFIDPVLSGAQLQALRLDIGQLEGVATVDYISPEKARKSYAKSFGDDLIGVLPENPLPPSFHVLLKSDFGNIDQIKILVESIKSLKTVDEVVFQENMLRLVNRYYLLGLIIASAIGATIFFISTILIFNTIRLTIHSRKSVIEIMRLVGATNTFIKAPFIIEGLLQGLIGSLLAAGLLWLTIDILRTLFFPGLLFPLSYFLFMLCSGVLLGLLGSYISVGKYLRF